MDEKLNYPEFRQTCYAYLTSVLKVPVGHDRFLVLWNTQYLFKEAITRTVMKALDKQTSIDMEKLTGQG